MLFRWTEYYNLLQEAQTTMYNTVWFIIYNQVEKKKFSITFTYLCICTIEVSLLIEGNKGKKE